MNLLEVNNICKTYGSGETAVHALKKVSFSVPKGEYVAIVGESGSGKSTLLNMIGALDTPTSGKVVIGGKEIFSMNDNRLTHLIPEILELADNSVLKDPDMLQIALRPAVELSYLRKEEQADLFAIMDEMDCTPSHAQAIKMRRMSEAKTGDERLSKDAMAVIMEEEKGNQKEQFKIPKEKISRFFAPGTPTQKIEDTIVKALELYRKRQRSLER